MPACEPAPVVEREVRRPAESLPFVTKLGPGSVDDGGGEPVSGVGVWDVTGKTRILPATGVSGYLGPVSADRALWAFPEASRSLESGVEQRLRSSV